MTQKLGRGARGALGRGLVVLLLVAGTPGRGERGLASAMAQEPAPERVDAADGHGDRRVVRIPSEIPVRRGHEPGEAGGRPLGLLVAAGILVVAGTVWARVRRRNSGPGTEARAGTAGWTWWRWLRTARSSGDARLVQSFRLTPRASVHVVRWDGKELLLGCADQAVTVLGERTLPSEGRGGRIADGVEPGAGEVET